MKSPISNSTVFHISLMVGALGALGHCDLAWCQKVVTPGYLFNDDPTCRELNGEFYLITTQDPFTVQFERPNEFYKGMYAYHVCLLKNLGSRHAFCPFWSPGYSLCSFFRPGSCSCNLRGWLTAEESHQPFQVLRRGRQVELLAHEAHPAQPQSTESDVILQLCEECFHFPPSPLRDRERGCLGQGVGTLPRRLAGVDGKGPILASRAAALLRALATALHRRIINVCAGARINSDVLQDFAFRADIAVLFGYV